MGVQSSIGTTTVISGPFVATRGPPMPSVTAIAIPRRERPKTGARGWSAAAYSAFFSDTASERSVFPHDGVAAVHHGQSARAPMAA
jgi:hypothetical protein